MRSKTNSAIIGAYLCQGFSDGRPLSDELMDNYGGHIGVMHIVLGCIGHIASFLDSLPADTEFPSVFEYDVIEPTGRAIREFADAHGGCLPGWWWVQQHFENGVEAYFDLDEYPQLGVRNAINTARLNRLKRLAHECFGAPKDEAFSIENAREIGQSILVDLMRFVKDFDLNGSPNAAAQIKINTKNDNNSPGFDACGPT